MLTRTDFARQVADAYRSLYDLVDLRNHPLADLLVPGPSPDPKEKGWRLHRLLLEAIDELRPGPRAPVFSHEWRRHRLMVLRYADGIEAQAVAAKLGVSRRHYYREHEAALKAISHILWQRHMAGGERGTVEEEGAAEALPEASRLELLRLEAARMAQSDRFAPVGDVLEGALSLLREKLRQRDLEVRVSLPGSLPEVALDRGLLRQMLLSMLGYLIERAEHAALAVAVQAEGGALRITLAVEPSLKLRPTPLAEVEERLAALSELAALGRVRVEPLWVAGGLAGFALQLPLAPQRTVLVVDDNADVLELVRRYLGLHGFRVATAQTAHEALDLACRLQPIAITLDLMMPGEDGWDLLQQLLNRPATASIPVVVCSVLREKELALSMGAVAFLEKPITERALLAVLERLQI
ncbi:MAG: response regulator [Anaerolineae bacterium]|nr:response regulator [Anaerolineae bacterium]